MRHTVRQLAAILGLVGVVFVAESMGLFAPLSNLLVDMRFALTNRPPTGDVVLAEIDSASIDALGRWPWSRSVYARLTDALVADGAADIAFDIDFSSPSTPQSDAAFAAALDRAGGFAILAAFQQRATTAGHLGATHFNLPIPELSKNAWMGSVNVRPEVDGRVRWFPTEMRTPSGSISSLPIALAGEKKPRGGRFLVDYSIDARQIDRISIAGILAGTVDPARIEGKKVIVGAGAVELRDDFVVPRYGTLSGPMLQALAVETLMQHRLLVSLGAWPSALLTLLFGLLVVFASRGRSPRQIVLAAVAGSATTEILALGAQAAGFVAATGGAQFSIFVLLVGALGRELDFGRSLLTRVTGQRDRVQGLLTRVIADNFDGIIVIDEDDTIITASRLAQDVLGDAVGATLVGRRAREILPPGMLAALQRGRIAGAVGETPERQLRELTMPADAGGMQHLEFMVSLSDIPGEAGAHRRVACMTFRDVTERRENEERLSYVASHDVLTGALNRHRLVEQIAVLAGDPRSRAKGMTIVLVDLARFKQINDSLGHSYGDEVLKQVVHRLWQCGPDLVARLGADSFALLSAEIMSQSALEAFCDMIIEQVRRPYRIGAHRAIVGAAIGVTDSVRSGTDAEALISHADMALSRAKVSRRHDFIVFEPDMDVELKERQALELALRHAIERDELVVLYQPQVDLATSRVVGVEALVRWHHPELGVVSPDRFIGLAEETGLIIELGRWVLETACREVAKWPEHVRLAVNASPVQIEFGDVVADVEKALAESGLSSQRLDIEITEGLLIEKPDAVRGHLNALAALGVGVALDDFGTGYSSLSYLGGLPVDKIKIDRSFISRLPGSMSSSAIVAAILTLCQTLGKTVVAEGIETADQAWLLRLGGCEIGQGFYFGRPRSAEEVEAAIREGTNEWRLDTATV